MQKQATISLLLLLTIPFATLAEEKVPDYSKDVAPILTKYCAGCHNEEDAYGELVLDSFGTLQKGGENGPAVLPGEADSSRLIRVITGEAKPKMPPEDSPVPKPAEIAILKAWIDGGAKGPDGTEPDRTILRVPEIESAPSPEPITALDWSPDGDLIAVGKYGGVDLLAANDRKLVRSLERHPGKVNMVRFSATGESLVTASGIVGLYGEARVYSVNDGTLQKTFRGHRDTLYAAVPSPDGELLATGSYDKAIILWDMANGEQLRTLDGHNDAIYDLAFHPAGTLLASASGDETCKVWHVATGRRIDTLGQPLKEQFTVAFTPDGKSIAAGGIDNRIRVWSVASVDEPAIYPIEFARFAHEGALVGLAYARDGDLLITASEDRTIKLWDTASYTQVKTYPRQDDVISTLAVAPSGEKFAVGLMNGELRVFDLPEKISKSAGPTKAVAIQPMEIDATAETIEESEPNDDVAAADQLPLPGVATGTIGEPGDVDLYRFHAKAGQQWTIEINAARTKSPLDSRIEVLDSDGKPVLNTLLAAVRDSYITFRSIDSTTRDVRLFNWQEMELNQYVYFQGEVCKLYRMPQGPDSGFNLYPHDGKRHTYFGTTATTHALHEPCYVVQPHPPGSEIPPNGLPVFPIYYENDDDSERELGKDSRLFFTVPADGEYHVVVRDVREFGGDKYTYTLLVRPQVPDFKIRLPGGEQKVAAGSGSKFVVTADRIDGFEGPIQVDIENVPPGFHVTTPLTIQEGHLAAWGTINALPDAEAPADDAKMAVTATAEIADKAVTREVGTFGPVKLNEKPKILVAVSKLGKGEESPIDPESDGPKPTELVIHPGKTIRARLRIERNDFDGRVRFDARNLPHGVIVDNIGLNGILINEGKTERTIFLTAAGWVPETTREFYLESREVGNQTSWPVILRVRSRER